MIASSQKEGKRKLPFGGTSFWLFSLALLILCIPIFIYANSAEPPGIVIIVSHPPENLEMQAVNASSAKPIPVQKKMWEGYYCFYRYDLPGWDDFFEDHELEKSKGEEAVYLLKITQGEKSFVCTLKKSQLRYHNNIFTLDLKRETLQEGKALSRSIFLVGLRVLFTLLLEGFVFLSFGYRKKSSWLLFFAVNLVTQGALNGSLNGYGPLNAYVLLNLYLLELLVFLVEMIAFPLLLRERSKKRAVLMAFLANMVSLFAGGFLLMELPF